jgi:transcription elongation GreA/GreB family factor
VTRAEALEALTEALVFKIQTATDRAKATARSATHAESKQENDKDTRALEETYLAAGQAQRVAELELDLLEMRALARQIPGDTVAVGALVEMEDDDGVVRRLFVARRAGGVSASVGDEQVQVVTPGSPVGRALIGMEEGDEVRLIRKGGPRTYEIVGVA